MNRMMKFFQLSVFCLLLSVFMACEEPLITSPKAHCPCACDQIIDHKLPEGSFRFVVTGDPQYNYKDMNPDQASVINAGKVSARFSQKICCEQYKGAVISGDLTHHARLDGLDYINHGLGKIIELKKAKWSNDCLSIWNDVRTRKRIPEVSGSYPNVHYSWDWEGVHFIQLNLSPADRPVQYKIAQNPFMALSFLKADLAKQVGDSGRPVILVHHYGFDIFSMGIEEDGNINPGGEWWTAEDRRQYWEVLKPYNVIVIFSGHAHYCDPCYLPWDGENVGEAKVKSPFIPTFVAGAAREGKYLDCEINQDSLIVHRFNHEEQLFRKAFAIKRDNSQ